EARGKVYCTADHRVIEAKRGAEIAGEHLSAVDADTSAQCLAMNHQLREAAQITGGFRSAHRMVRFVDWRAPGREDGVADIFDDYSLVLENALRCLFKIGGEN